MATKEEIDEQALQEAYAKIGDDTVRNYSPQGVFRAAFLAGRESMEKEIKYINIYHDAEYNGRFISNFEHATFDEAFKARDQHGNDYLETIGVVRQAIGESK